MKRGYVYMPAHAHNMPNVILIANVGSRPTCYKSEVNTTY